MAGALGSVVHLPENGVPRMVTALFRLLFSTNAHFFSKSREEKKK
ncbi:hypothetical protein [Tenacibaculum litopenaei]|jgi:hypothetical protein